MTSGIQAITRGKTASLRAVPYLLIAAVLVVMYWRAAEEMVDGWTQFDSYYSHGVLIPVISLFFVWKQRRPLAEVHFDPTPWGYALVLGAAMLLLIGDRLSFRVFGQLSLIPMLTGCSLLLLGKKRTALLWFPLAFLIFMIPIPSSITQSLVLDLKLFAAQCAVWLAQGTGLAIVREGSSIHFPTGTMVVGQVCGGLRSLIALLAFGALMAYISKTRPWARILLLVFAGPIAIASNVLRIFLLCVVGYLWGSTAATGVVHDISGIMIFAVAFALFFTLETFLRRLAPSTGTAES